MKTTTKIAALTIVLACGVNSLQGAEAKENWTRNCQSCHGPDGKGQTMMGKRAGARDYTDPKVQEALKDENAIKAIKEGLKDGDKVVMKPYTSFTDEEVKALVAYIRAFKKE